MDNSVGNRKTMVGEGRASARPDDNRSMGGAETLRPEGAPLGRIDQYELIRELGGGGFGVVYLARDTVAGIEVAVKGLPPLVRNNAEELERIRANFALVSKLHDRHIAAALVLHPAKDVSYADERVRQALRVAPGDTLMVMAYAPGVTLSSWRKQFSEGKVPVTQAVEVCRQIAAALDYAHGEKVVHRDVKPSNVMVETREEVRGNKEEVKGGGTPNAQVAVRVLDFGLAAEIRSSLSRVSQEKGDTSGTRPYMAPEQWAGRRQDGRTDQYALAALFYELVSGAVPFASAFDTGDPVIMANAALTMKPEPLAELSKAQNAALLRGLAKEPAERYATCGELVAALGGGKSQPQRAQRHGGKKVLLWVCIAVVAMLAYASYRSYASYADRLAKERAAASVAREAAQKLDRGQGFGARLDALEVTWREAEAARLGQGWGQALSGYDAVLAACKALEGEEVSRGDAEARKGEAEKAMADADQAGSASDAKDLYAAGGRASSRAAEAFGKGAFAEASKAWQESASSYASAKTRALAVQSCAKAKAAFESELSKSEPTAGGRALAGRSLGEGGSPRAALLESHGGAKWVEVKRLRTLGEASANDPAAGADAYKQALAALPAAVAEAQAAEHGAKLAAALAAAREAKTAGAWQACKDKADEALALEAGNAEAAALKAEAERNLTPTLTVACDVQGAQVSDGQRTYAAPHTFELKPGGGYSFAVTAGADRADRTDQSDRSKRYKPATFDLTADWRGPRTRRVALEEVVGPPDGEPWTSPAAGMEFVWVPALKIWVGKYEVTNGEYRKKEPSHDSKDFQGQSLNGDRQPAVYVNFDDAKAYAGWLTEQDKGSLNGLRYRVIAENEWLTCAQCGDGREYPWGSSMPPKWGNYSDSASPLTAKIGGYTDGFAVTCPVERSGANEWGLYGLGGNVWEGCASDASGSSFGAWRGAAWGNDDPGSLQCTVRNGLVGSYRGDIIGFRLALSR